MSRPFISRTASLSSNSSFTSLGGADGDAEHDAQPTGTLGPGSKQLQLDMKRTRKRFSHEQLVVLEQAYYHTSHPSREERQRLAGLTGMDVKSVTIWFQNKRQTERKVSTGSASTRNAPLPQSLYPVLYSTTAHAHPLIGAALPRATATLRLPDSSSFSFPSSLSKPAPNPNSRSKSGIYSPRTLRMSLSLDHVASRAERPPRTPSKPARRASSYEHWTEPAPALWESIPSSPSTPERPKTTGIDASTSRTSPSTRDYLDFASARHGHGKHGSRIRGRRTLEWACAAARFSVDKEDIEMSSKVEFKEDKKDIEIVDANAPKLATPALTFSPALFDSERSPAYIDDDASTEIIDTEVESVDECQEAITPDASQILYSYNSSPTHFGNSQEKEKINTEMARNMKNLRIEKDSAILDAAWALCGLSSIRGQQDGWMAN